MKNLIRIAISVAMVIALIGGVLPPQMAKAEIPQPAITTVGIQNAVIEDFTAASDGFVIVGYIQGGSAFAAKVKSDGTPEWTLSLPGNFAYAVAKSSDGNFVVVGSTKSSSVDGYQGDSDILVAKFSPDGNLVWAKAIGTRNTDYGYAILTDGNDIYVGGMAYKGGSQYRYGSAILAKMSGDGELQWMKAYYPQQGFEYFYDMAFDGDTIVAVGMAAPNWGAYKAQIGIITLSKEGEVQAVKNFGSDGAVWDEGFSVAVADDGYIIGGYVGNGPKGGSDIFVMKLSKDLGTKEWETFIGGKNKEGTNYYYDYSRRPLAVAIYGGSIYVASYTKSSDGDFSGLYTSMQCGGYPCPEPVLIELDRSGAVSDIKVYGDQLAGGFHALGETADGKLAAVGVGLENGETPYGIVAIFGAGAATPEKPTISELPQVVTTPTLTVSGTAEGADYVEVVVNNDSYTASVTNGTFSVVVNLEKGPNRIKARACNAVGCSPYTDTYTVYYTENAQTVGINASILTTPALGDKTFLNGGIKDGDYYIVVGTAIMEGTKNPVVAKVSGEGQAIWIRYLGGGTDYGDGFAVTKAEDGYIVVGTTQSPEVNGYHNGTCGKYPCKDILVAKVSEDGNLKWQKAIGTENDDAAYSVLKVSDGYIVVGYTNKNTDKKLYGEGFIFKISDSGEILWQKKITTKKIESLRDIVATENGYIAVGMAWGAKRDIAIVSLGEDGSVAWTKILGSDGYDEAYAIAKISDNMFAVSGYTAGLGDGFHQGTCGNHTCEDGIVITIDGNGSVIGSKAIGGSGKDVLSDIAVSGDTLIVVGTTQSTDGDMDGIVTPHTCGELQCEEGFVAAMPTSLIQTDIWALDGETMKSGLDGLTADGSTAFGYYSPSKDVPPTGVIVGINVGTSQAGLPAKPTVEGIPSSVSYQTLTITGQADSNTEYVKAVVTYADGTSSEFKAQPSEDGSFKVVVNLKEGTNTINIYACNNLGCSEPAGPFTVKYTPAPPQAPTLNQPSEETTYKEEIEISGYAPSAGLLKVFVNGEEKVSQQVEEGPFQVMVPLERGLNTITARLCNSAGCSEESNAITIRRAIIIEMWLYRAEYRYCGETRMMDAAPFIIPPGRTVVPIRFVAEGLGFDVQWVGETRQVIITGEVSGESLKVILDMHVGKPFKVGERKVYPGKSRVIIQRGSGEPYTIDLRDYNGEDMGVPVIYAGRTYVPVRFIAEIFGAQVLWDGTEKKVTIILSD